jgi:hypothetical protein
MRREWDMVSEIYGSRDDVAIEADIEFGVGRDDLRELLKEPTDLFHYIGHVDDRGFDCIDGFLDAETIDDAGMKAFLLNACHSFAQGEALIEAGASAGIVSLSEVGNQSAIEFGKTLVRFFHRGFSMGTALTLMNRYTEFGSRYIGTGDVGLMLTQCEDSLSILYEILEENGESITVKVWGYPNRNRRMGSIVYPFAFEDGIRFLSLTCLATATIPKSRLERLVEPYLVPMVVDDSLAWSDNW